MKIQTKQTSSGNTLLRFGMYTPDAQYDAAVREVEKDLAQYDRQRLAYEGELKEIEAYEKEYEEKSKQGWRFAKTPDQWRNRMDNHYPRIWDMKARLDRIGLYSQAEWLTDPAAGKLIVSTIKLIAQMPPRYAKSLREYAMQEVIGYLPRGITDAVEAFFEEHQNVSDQERFNCRPIAETYKIKPRSIPEESDTTSPGVQYHIGNLVGVAGNNQGMLSIHDVTQHHAGLSPEHQMVGGLLQTLSSGIQTDQLLSSPEAITTKKAKPPQHTVWLDQLQALQKTLSSIPKEALPQVALNRIEEIRRELDAGHQYLQNLVTLVTGQIKEISTMVKPEGKNG